ncbi:hypothetical protein B5X24_HaOG208455 [Helicoverpa armigera]|uniref:Uncharacterized protein n=1 Tax=Helicoverpa armigera TaxID=29058 RepID=A0A2W1BL27_HELAM|nr:hypothetical protein B5X24_HaOG208455 [Helicoverpa armigera]
MFLLTGQSTFPHKENTPARKGLFERAGSGGRGGAGQQAALLVQGDTLLRMCAGGGTKGLPRMYIAR